MKKIYKRVGIGLVSIAVVGALGLGIAGNYLFDFAVSTHTSKERIFSKEDTSSGLSQDETSGKVVESAKTWLQEKSSYIEQQLTAVDGLRLIGYEIMSKAPSHVWVVTVHGYGGKALDMSNYIYRFNQMGYNVLAPDLRGHGKSEGDYIGMGWDDRLDVMSWIEHIIEKDPEAEIMLFGVSMGAATVMMTSGEELPEQVKLVIEDCGYTSAWEQFTYQLHELFGLPEFPLIPAANLVANLRAGYDFKEASALKQVAKTQLPMLLIHGDLDDFVPFSMLEELYEAAGGPKEKLVIEGAAHAEASTTNPELYWSTIEAFIQYYL